MGPSTATPRFLLIAVVSVVAGLVLLLAGHPVACVWSISAGTGLYILHRLCVWQFRRVHRIRVGEDVVDGDGPLSGEIVERISPHSWRVRLDDGSLLVCMLSRGYVGCRTRDPEKHVPKVGETVFVERSPYQAERGRIIRFPRGRIVESPRDRPGDQ